MEQLTFSENKNESLCAEIIRQTESFVKDSRLALTKDFLSVDLIDQMKEAVTAFKVALEEITPKNDDENTQIKSALQDLTDFETTCDQRKTLQ